VALSGLGGDELFAGYDTFTRVPQALALRRNRVLSWSAKLGAAILRTRGAAKAAEAANRAPDALCMYLLRRELFLPSERRQLHDLPFDCDPETGVNLDLLAEVRAEASGLDEVNRISLFELQLYMRHMLLRDADAFSMAAPIEYRVPFLDHVLVETVFALPGEWKRPDPRPKPLLLDIASSPISGEVWDRPKQGFTFPWSKWLASDGALHATARDAVHDSASWRSLDVDPAGVLKIWNRFEAGDRRVSPLQLLAFMTLRDFTDRYRVYAT
jgi:asparagine synthase (glutamine-hydrolysing)